MGCKWVRILLPSLGSGGMGVMGVAQHWQQLPMSGKRESEGRKKEKRERERVIKRGERGTVGERDRGRRVKFLG